MHAARTRIAALAVALLLPLVACDDADSPVDPGQPVDLWVGTYQLTHVDGRPLPVIVYQSVNDPIEGGSVIRITATEGSLLLDAEGRYELRVRHTVHVDGQPAPGSNWTDRGDYQVLATGLAFSSNFIQNRTFRGLTEADAVTTRQDLAGEGRSADYRFSRQ